MTNVELLSRAAALLDQLKDVLDYGALWSAEGAPKRDDVTDVLAAVADVEDDSSRPAIELLLDALAGSADQEGCTPDLVVVSSVALAAVLRAGGIEPDFLGFRVPDGHKSPGSLDMDAEHEADCHEDCGPEVDRSDTRHAHENEDGVCWHDNNDAGNSVA